MSEEADMGEKLKTTALSGGQLKKLLEECLDI